MFIHKIKIKNFKSIYDENEIDFDKISGMWKISGQVGAGKTTLGEAIIFGLFGTITGKNNADLISWGEKKSVVELWLTSKGHNIYIKRENNIYGQSPVYVTLDNEELIFTNKRDAQNQLESEYYDVSKSTVEMLCIISFNNFKSLTTLNTSDTKKFLDQVLGFSLLTNYADKCKELRALNSSKIYELNSQIDNLNSQITKLQELSNITKIDGDINKEKHELNDLEIHNQYIKDKFNQKLKQIREEINEHEKKIMSTLVIGKKLKKEIEFIEKGICPTCGAKIDQSKLEEKKSERTLLLDNYNNLMKEKQKLQDQYNSTQDQYNQESSQCLLKINDKKSFIIKLEESLKHININQDEILKLKKNIKNIDKILSKHKTEDNEWAMLYNILSVDIRSKILDSFIPSLNKNIQIYAQRLQQPYNVYFDNNFKCNIIPYGHDKLIPVTSLSTGQLKIIDMIVILGVLNTIIGANGINIMFLDELFSNLDDDLRNEMCKLLSEKMQNNKNNTLFIISHQNIEGRFDGYIDMNLDHTELHKKKSIMNIYKK